MHLAFHPAWSFGGVAIKLHPVSGPHPCRRLLAEILTRITCCKLWHAEGGRTVLSKDADWLNFPHRISLPHGNPCSGPKGVQTTNNRWATFKISGRTTERLAGRLMNYRWLLLGSERCTSRRGSGKSLVSGGSDSKERKNSEEAFKHSAEGKGP